VPSLVARTLEYVRDRNSYKILATNGKEIDPLEDLVGDGIIAFKRILKK
jgi:hypothetical protein